MTQLLIKVLPLADWLNNLAWSRCDCWLDESVMLQNACPFLAQRHTVHVIELFLVLIWMWQPVHHVLANFFIAVFIKDYILLVAIFAVFLYLRLILD